LNAGWPAGHFGTTRPRDRWPSVPPVPERTVHAKGSAAYGTLTITHDITKYTKAKVFLVDPSALPVRGPNDPRFLSYRIE
jgi:hypothetical protein